MKHNTTLRVVNFWTDLIDISYVEEFPDGFKRTQYLQIPVNEVDDLIARLYKYSKVVRDAEAKGIAPQSFTITSEVMGLSIYNAKEKE